MDFIKYDEFHNFAPENMKLKREQAGAMLCQHDVRPFCRVLFFGFGGEDLSFVARCFVW